MSVSSGRLPSAGFVAIILTAAASAALFAWGFAQPPLDRVWEIHHLMKIGAMTRLDAEDRRLLAEELEKHPDLARDLLDGHAIGIISASIDGWLHTPGATLLRTPESASVKALTLDVHTPEDLLPVRLVLHGDSWREERAVAAQGAVTLPLPPPGDEAEVIELEVGGGGLGSDPSALGLRVTWEDGR